MRTTIDAAGRIVIPKRIRDEAGLSAGTEVEVALADGRVEIEPATKPMRVAQWGGRVVIEPETEMPALTTVEVRAALERVRR